MDHKIALDQGAGDLLDEQRVAVRLFGDKAQQILGDVLAEQPRGHLPHLVVGEPVERDLRKKRHIRPPQLIARPVRRHQQDRHLGQAAGQEGDEILRALVPPVQVFEDQHQRALPRRGGEDIGDRLLGSCPLVLGLETGQRRIVAGQAEQQLEEG